MAQHCSLGILPRGLDKKTRLSEQEGIKTVPAINPRVSTEIVTLSPWERVGVRGVSALSATPTVHTKLLLFTNWLN
jgi:hypothetical protein